MRRSPAVRLALRRSLKAGGRPLPPLMLARSDKCASRRRSRTHSLEHLVAEFREFLTQRHDEPHADRMLLAPHGARRVPLAKPEPCPLGDEAPPDCAAVA